MKKGSQDRPGFVSLALCTALESLATFLATVRLCNTPFEPARAMTDAACERDSRASSAFFFSRVDRTFLTAVFTEERTWRFLALRFRLCLCRLIGDLLFAKRCLQWNLDKSDKK